MLEICFHNNNFIIIDQVLVIVSGTLGSLLFIGILILVALSIALVSESIIVEYNYWSIIMINSNIQQCTCNPAMYTTVTVTV